MQRSKQQALMFLLGAFLVGGALGFSAERVMGHQRPGTSDEQAFRDRFYGHLQLTATQRASVDSILDQRNRHWDEVMAPVRPRLDSIKREARNQIRTLLDDDQRQRFEQFLAENNAKKKQSSKD